MREGTLLQLVQRIRKHLGRLCELLRLTVISERIPLERKERELVELSAALQILDEATHPSGFSEFNSAGDLRLFDVLQTWPAKPKRGTDFVNRFFKLKIQCPEMLRIHELPVGFFSHFDPLNRITSSLQVSNFSGGVFRSVIQHRHRN